VGSVPLPLFFSPRFAISLAACLPNPNGPPQAATPQETDRMTTAPPFHAPPRLEEIHGELIDGTGGPGLARSRDII